ncbi:MULTISPECIES: DUF4747 family protein [Pseudoalteromonas]|uniref:DUF4747 family protein n=1 Tax=Pseudoalteromonas TaxID=53246 RepID=UPI00030E1D53|nr:MULTISPECIES: DUF4747 family protein [Pseudoalteromonas]MCF6142949.1 hypothetical protein [Pseudoalteromonas mariniglutinosa NCIMB 1770]
MELKTSAGALNITIDKHLPTEYKKLFESAFALKKQVNIRGTTWGLLCAQSKVKDIKADVPAISGDIFKFTQIREDADWLNLNTNDFATDADLAEINLPENLKPNSTRFTYFFFPESHTLVYEAYYKGNELTPNTAVDFFKKLLNSAELQEDFGEVNVIHFPEKEAVQKALQLMHKRTIHMIINNPNAFGEIEKRYLKKAEKRQIAKVETKITAKTGESIQVDQELRNEAKIAANNGSLVVKGYDGKGTPRIISTKDMPFIKHDYFDIKNTLPYDAFKRLAISIEEIIKKLL